MALPGATLFVLYGLGDWLLPDLGPRWTDGMLVTLVFLVVWPILLSSTLVSLRRFAGASPSPVVDNVGPWLVLAGGALTRTDAVGRAVWVGLLGAILLAAGGILYAVHIMRSVPKHSLVSAGDPLTKGDDACMKHFVFAARFLAIAVLLLLARAVAAIWAFDWVYPLTMAGLHVFVIGHLLLLIYGLGHLWVPRFSGVPAIAAGAIKGELHTTLLGVTGITIGFLTGIRSFTSALGFFVFVGMFTYMGVLGANMMRRKSRTHRVTPEFVYIPWTFTGIFWLISAVLMGLFLNAVPAVLADRSQALATTHMAAALLGGMVQLWLGWQTRMAPTAPRFQGAMRSSFFLFNAGVAIYIMGAYGTAQLRAGGIVLMAVALLLYTPFLAKLMAAKPMETA